MIASDKDRGDRDRDLSRVILVKVTQTEITPRYVHGLDISFISNSLPNGLSKNSNKRKDG
jgi:hypothetical protein